MKICFLTPEFPKSTSTPSGGIGASILNLSHGLIKLGHEVVVLVYGQEKDEVVNEEEFIIYKIKNVKIKGLSFYFTQKKIQRLINTLYASRKIDIVEAPEWTGFSAFINVKCPLIIKLHGSDTYFCHLDKRNVKFKNKYFEKRTLKKADAIIAVSDFVGKLTNQVFKLQKDYKVIPNAIDTRFFNPEPNKQETQQILYFGTLIRKKGVLEIPGIFNRVVVEMPNTQLVIVGNDASDIRTNTSSIWKLMEPLFNSKAKGNVRYLGKVPYSKIKTYINESSLCIFPSFAEALPVSWLEAMAMEKAIVASNIGWANEMIENGKDAFLVPPTNHEEFSSKIISVLQDERLQNSLSKNAREKVVTKYDVEVVAKQHIDFYKNVIKNA